MSSGLPKPGTLIPPPKNSVTSVTSAQPAPTQPSDKTAAEASTAAEAAIQAAAQASNMSLSAYASLGDFDKILVAVTATNRKMEKLDSRVDIIEEKTDEHIEETNRKFQNTEERLEKLQAQIDGIMAGDVTVQPSVSEELRMEKDKFERTVGLEPVELTQEETPEEQAAMDLACYYGALRKLGIPQIQLDKFNILRVYRTANTGHPLRMYAEFETSGPVRVINRLVGNRQGIKIQPWVASQLIYDMYEPLSTLAYNLRLYGRENGKKIWTQIMFMDNVLRLELAMEGVEGRHFLPLTINNTAEAVSFISNKGTGAQRKRRRSEVRPPSPLLSNEHRVHWAEAGEAREERRPLTDSLSESRPVAPLGDENASPDSASGSPAGHWEWTPGSHEETEENLSLLRTGNDSIISYDGNGSLISNMSRRSNSFISNMSRQSNQSTVMGTVQRRDQNQVPAASHNNVFTKVSKYRNISDSSVPVQSVRTHGFELNMTKTLQKLQDSTVIGDWEVHRLNVIRGKSQCVFVKFSTHVYRAVTCGVFKRMATESWKMQGESGSRYRVNNVEEMKDIRGSVYQTQFDLFHETNKSGMTENLFRVKVNMFMTKSAIQIQGKGAESTWETFIKPLIEAEAVELRVELDSLGKEMREKLAEALKTKDKEASGAAKVCKGCKTIIEEQPGRTCRQCQYPMHGDCLTSGSCRPCRLNAGLEPLPPPSPGSPAINNGTLKLHTRKTRFVSTMAPSPQPPAAREETMGPDALGVDSVTEPQMPSRPPAARDLVTDTAPGTETMASSTESVTPRPPAARGSATETGLEADPVSHDGLTPRPLAAPELAMDISLEASSPSSKQPGPEGAGSPAVTSEGHLPWGGIMARPTVSQLAQQTSPSQSALAHSTPLTRRPRGRPPGRGRSTTQPGQTRGEQPRRTTFNANIALRDSVIEELQVKNSLLDEENKRSNSLIDHYRRMSLAKERLPEGEERLVRASESAPTIYNNNTVNVGSCKKCERTVKSTSQVSRGGEVVEERAEQEEQSVMEPEDKSSESGQGAEGLSGSCLNKIQ